MGSAKPVRTALSAAQARYASRYTRPEEIASSYRNDAQKIALGTPHSVIHSAERRINMTTPTDKVPPALGRQQIGVPFSSLRGKVGVFKSCRLTAF